MSIRKKVDSVTAQIKKLEIEKDILQQQCEHEDSSEVTYLYKEGKRELVQMCDICDILLYSLDNKCTCVGGYTGRILTADFNYIICSTCGGVVK